MVTASIIRHLLSDSESLHAYHHHESVTFDDVKRRLFLLERQENYRIPDHYYRLTKKKSFDKIETLPDILCKGLYRLADEMLELREHRIYVKHNMLNRWQELITEIPPLILQMAFLRNKKPCKDLICDDKQRRDYFIQYILPNTRYTALPYPFVPQIENYIAEKHGFHDLHIHLNGSTEIDRVWQDFLAHPDLKYQDVDKNEKVREQLEQENINPLDLLELLKQARQLRQCLFSLLFNCSKPCDDTDIKSRKNADANTFYHPFGELISGQQEEPKYPIAIEGLMYILVLNKIAEKQNEHLAALFHYYLLILGLVNRLLVQQLDQYGFEEFQKITLNDMREVSEKKAYLNRFFQLHGNEQRNIRFMEGRFSPKVSETENVMLLQNIQKAWTEMRNSIQTELHLADGDLPELKLIAHFIKQADKHPASDIRHRRLRLDVWNKARTLALIKAHHPEQMEHVVAVDAASSEFDAPPEVFVPAFRYLRRHGFQHFTYHAGEDFYHIISGLRAIYEAVEFNDMQCGDRIGHATAAGISVDVWMQNVGDSILVHRGDYLDDLVFCYRLIVNSENETLKLKIPLLAHKVQELSYDIYHRAYSIQTFEGAWKLRRYCPMLLFANPAQVKLETTFDDEEWCEIEEQHLSTTDDRRHILQCYHSAESKKKCFDPIIEVKVEEIFSKAEITMLQWELLNHLHKKEIVIETLPTSNVRIGHHRSFDTYHLYNWLQWKKEGHSIPPIVVGTDDTGIFATNIFNEYANIYCMLTSKGMGHSDAMSVIERLDKNGRIYRFT